MKNKGIHANHRSLGNVLITAECLAMQLQNTELESIFVEHDGEIKEVTRTLVELDQQQHDDMINPIWVSRDTLPDGGRVLAFSPVYKIVDPMRFRILDAQFIIIATDVTHWMYLDSIAPKLGLAEDLT